MQYSHFQYIVAPIDVINILKIKFYHTILKFHVIDTIHAFVKIILRIILT
jgi:hypothetical protein